MTKAENFYFARKRTFIQKSAGKPRLETLTLVKYFNQSQKKFYIDLCYDYQNIFRRSEFPSHWQIFVLKYDCVQTRSSRLDLFLCALMINLCFVRKILFVVAMVKRHQQHRALGTGGQGG